MYQLPTWRYWLVGIVLVAATLLALPNVFVYESALQISRDDRAAMDAAVQERVNGILKAANIQPTAQYTNEDRLVVRFPSSAEQAKARAAIQSAAAGEYVVALTRESTMPNWMRSIGLNPMALGLDLRGGVHFLYEVDVEGAIGQGVERLERDIRTQLRDDRIPYTSVVIDGTRFA